MSPPPPPPPPPPPLCFPFGSNKPKRRLTSDDATSVAGSYSTGLPPSSYDEKYRPNTYSSTSSLTRTDSLSFKTDSEDYGTVRGSEHPDWQLGKKGPRMVRANTMAGTKPPKEPSSGSKWGFLGGKKKEKDNQKDLVVAFPGQPPMSEKLPSNGGAPRGVPLYDPPVPPARMDSRNSRETRSSRDTKDSRRSKESRGTRESRSSHKTRESDETRVSGETRPSSGRSRSYTQPTGKSSTPSPQTSQRSTGARGSGGSGTQGGGPSSLVRNDSQNTLVGSALERKINDVEPSIERADTRVRLDDLRKIMTKDSLDYYIIPSEDSHQSEYVAATDKRREYISGFSGSSGQAIVTPNHAFLFTDSRYWLQAQEQLDENWELVRVGSPGLPKDWIEWLVDRARNSRIGIDARMISHEKAAVLNSKLVQRDSKMIYPPQNLVDLVWRDKIGKSREPLYRQPDKFTGQQADKKLARLRDWIANQPPSIPSYSKGPPTESQIHVATLVSSLPAIAYLLNLRGSDIPFNPLFHAYFFISQDTAILFADAVKVNEDIHEYLHSLGVERRDYVEIWQFLRRREWGAGKVLITPQTSFAISLMLTHLRYTVAPNYVEEMLSIKNDTELHGLREAYIRDGVCYVRFLAWLEDKFNAGYDITEYEAAQRLTEFRRKAPYFMGLAYENISASGPNAALPHYSPRRSTARMIDKFTPYLNDSGGQYRDGTCDTTRTWHFGRPTPEQSDAYTRVLQGHIAIDSAVYPEGTSGLQLDVLARRALWRDGLNYGHGTGHGFGSFLTVHEGSHGFSSSVPLQAGHVVTNEPGFYAEGQWGIRLESALIVRPVSMSRRYGGNSRWLGFERLTCVPIQTKMVKESMITREEKNWLKDHNERCWTILSPLLKDDKRALAWLKRETTRGMGVATGPGGLAIDWD
ncbi:unnamed protein product [Mycena citricolor]|uniref:Creatinase/aminopeptidase n=1 Tax=Mycena citricolor TaxID=2018698 RepID=A0AAD2HS24_9AGAR|nr:unnamed protein product [Mycena citricolor]